MSTTTTTMTDGADGVTRFRCILCGHRWQARTTSLRHEWSRDDAAICAGCPATTPVTAAHGLPVYADLMASVFGVRR